MGLSWTTGRCYCDHALCDGKQGTCPKGECYHHDPPHPRATLS